MKFIFFFINLVIIFHFSLSAFCKRLENGCLKCNPLTNLCFRCENEALTPDNQGGCTGAKICKFGNNYCEKCNFEQNLCEKCENGYFQDNNGGCSYTDNCEISYNGECLKCKNDYILIGIRNYYDTLKICKYIYSTDLKHCINIDVIDGHCLECEEGYNITKGDKKCTNTENCFEMENGECNSCMEDYYLDKKQKKCIEKINEKKFQNCKISLNGKNCSECDDNYFLTDDLICIKVNYCSKSEKDICLKCKDGFFLSKNNQCSTTENCKNADLKTGICIQCSEGYYLDINNRKCEPYSKNENYAFCAKVKSNCLKCIDRYYFSENNLCSSSKNCSIVKDGRCIKCQGNFTLSKNYKCIEIEHCINVNDNYECIECEDNYYYDKLNKKCNLIESYNFQNCKITDNSGNKCGLCKNGFYINLSDNLCYSNKEFGQFYQCIISETGDNCTKCGNDFYLGYGDNKCTNTEGCHRSNENNVCEECEEDYCLNKKSSMCEWNYLIENERDKIFYKCKMTNSDATSCVSCEERYEVGNEGVCVDSIDCEEKKGDKCIKCKKEDEEGNFHCLNPLFGCVETYNSNCTKCDDYLNLLNYCNECEEGYELDEYFSCVLKKN